MESELSDELFRDPNYLPSSGTEESNFNDFNDCSSTPIKKPSDTEKETSKNDNLFSETLADDENETKDEFQQNKKLVKKNKSSRSATLSTVLDFPIDADSDHEIGMSLSLNWLFLYFLRFC